MSLHPILCRAGSLSHLFEVVRLGPLNGSYGIRWAFRDGHGSGGVEFLQVSRALVLDISDFRCQSEQLVSFAIEDAPVLKMRFKLSGCSLLCFDTKEEPMLGEHCSASVYSPRELQYERLTSGVAERSVTLHCDREFFLEELGLSPDVTPEPIRAFLTRQQVAREFRRMRMTAQMRRTLVELMQPPCVPQFFRAYREIKARELALSALSELLCEEGPTPAGNVKPSDRPVGLTTAQLLRATAWLHQNLSEEHDLRDLAAAVETTPARLFHAFRQATGSTLQQYRLRARVEHARELLANGRLPIKAVGQDCGFYDQAHLTRAFRSVYGTTPSQFRKQHRRQCS
jgi:AraC-like DNA-binding protein